MIGPNDGAELPSDHGCKCGGHILDVDGENVCGRCGTVYGYDAVYDCTQADGRHAHGGREYGSATTLSRSHAARDHSGRSIHKGTSSKLLRHNRWTQRYNRSLPAGMAQLDALSDSLAMNDAATQYAAYLFRRVAAAGFLAGRVRSHCTAAVALIACRRHGIHRTISDVVAATGLGKRDIYYAYRKIRERFEVDDIPVQDPAAFIARIGEAADIDEATRREALRTLESLDRQDVAGKDPMGVAAAVMYHACVKRGKVVRRSVIARAAGVSATTLANRCDALLHPIAN